MRSHPENIHGSQLPDPSGTPEVWQAAYRVLEQTISPENLRAWIQHLHFVGSENRENRLQVNLAADTDFAAHWVREKFSKAVEEAFSQVTGTPCTLTVSVVEGSSLDLDQLGSPISSQSFSTAPAQSAPAAIVPVESPVRAALPPVPPNLGVDTRYHFDSFVVGASNQFAHASAVAVAEQPGRQYNPLFLYSPPGLGKTHLLHAIGNHYLAKKPNGRVAYLSAERFVNELVDAIQTHKMPQFRSKYRESFDILLIDDIQFIAKKAASEEEFFHTFNEFHQSQRQIVVTSDRPPKEISGLEERIRTRFEQGLIADISPPEIETRLAILRAKAERDDIYLPEDVSTFLASYIRSNVRELEGILIRLQAQASLTGAEISLDMAKQELKLAVPEEGAGFTVDSIQNAVMKHFRVKPSEFKSTSRAARVVLPRQIAMYLIRKYTTLGLKEIAQYFGGMDHSTILHACSKIEKKLETDVELREAVEAVQNLL